MEFCSYQQSRALWLLDLSIRNVLERARCVWHHEAGTFRLLDASDPAFAQGVRMPDIPAVTVEQAASLLGNYLGREVDETAPGICAALAEAWTPFRSSRLPEHLSSDNRNSANTPPFTPRADSRNMPKFFL